MVSKTCMLFDIKRFAIHDGPGIRVTFFMQGCPLSCWWCHNPECHFTGEVLPTRFGRRAMAVEEVVAEAEKDRIFMDESGGGVTFSGGEPLHHPDFLVEALAACQAVDMHTAVDTSGYAPQEVMDRVMARTDLFLFDLKFIDDEAHRTYTGVSNRLILDNLARLDEASREVWLRFPVIPDITDRPEHLDALEQHLRSLRNIRKLSLLPYHEAGRGKYTRMGLADRMPEKVTPPTPERLAEIKKRFEATGFSVEIGG